MSKVKTRYAIRSTVTGNYIAQQGKTTWEQKECKGWALCSTEGDWIASIAETMQNVEIVIVKK